MNGIFAKNAVYALIQLRDTLEFDKSIPTLDKDGLSRSITLISSSISLDKGIIYGRFDTNSDSTRAYFDSKRHEIFFSSVKNKNLKPTHDVEKVKEASFQKQIQRQLKPSVQNKMNASSVEITNTTAEIVRF